jgi:RNA polymerase sigma-70 factor (ECF subfamily)
MQALGAIADSRAERRSTFEEFFLREYSGVVAVAYRVLGERAQAEDVAQDAFAKAHRHFRELRDRDRFRAWLVRMTWRLAIDRWRSERRRTAREQAVVVTTADSTTEHDMVSRERAEQLWRAIDALPEKLRIAIVLSAIEGHDVRTVAALLGLPEGTVKSRLFLARKGLARSLRCLLNTPSTR